MAGATDSAPLAAGESSEGAVVLFDGVCNFCNATLDFIVDRDPREVFRFAPLQSAVARRLLERHGLPGDAPETLVLIEHGRAYTRSTAALRITRRLRGAWPLLYGLILVPRPLRDALYAAFARRRYRWFGRREACRLPDPALRRRFLD